MHGGEVYSIITGTHQYSWDLPNGGMHIPCKYCFIANSEELKKISRYVRNNPANKALWPSSESSRGDEDVKAKPSTDKVKKEPLPLGEDSECINCWQFIMEFKPFTNDCITYHWHSCSCPFEKQPKHYKESLRNPFWSQNHPMSTRNVRHECTGGNFVCERWWKWLRWQHR